MHQRIAVETLSLSEVSSLFQESIEIAFPKFKSVIEQKVKKIKKAKIRDYKWVMTYEEFKGAKLNFYCQFLVDLTGPIVSIGMTHRTTRGMILVAVDTSNGGIPVNQKYRRSGWQKWVRIYTGHFCERYAERILKSETPTFQAGSEGIMFSDLMGPVRITDTIAEGIDEIEFQFKGGQAYGYRDSRSKIVYFKTVYSNEMLKGERIDFRDDWKEVLVQLHQLFKWK